LDACSSGMPRIVVLTLIHEKFWFDEIIGKPLRPE